MTKQELLKHLDDLRRTADRLPEDAEIYSAEIDGCGPPGAPVRAELCLGRPAVEDLANVFIGAAPRRVQCSEKTSFLFFETDGVMIYQYEQEC